MPDRRDRVQEALDMLCDTNRAEEDVVAEFLTVSRRWKPINRAFLLDWGLRIRTQKGTNA